MERFTYFCYQHLWKTLDWIFPPECSGCAAAGIRWCSDCESKLTPLQKNLCMVCGYPISRDTICTRCSEKRPEYTELRSVYEYKEELRNAIHHLKYYNDLGVGEVFGSKCANHIKNLKWKIDMIIPVPLGKKRRMERGYNQAALIAYPMALKLGIPYDSRKLQRIKETISQVEYHLEQRKQNVHEAFTASAAELAGKSVLVVDDVITTGSTIEDCARALKKAGATNVYGLSVARTMIKGDLT